MKTTSTIPVALLGICIAVLGLPAILPLAEAMRSLFVRAGMSREISALVASWLCAAALVVSGMVLAFLAVQAFKRKTMNESKHDAFRNALMETLPPAGAEWPMEHRIAWLQLAIYSFNMLYGDLPDGYSIQLVKVRQT